MPISPITTYLNRLRADLRTGDATERTHYPTLKELIESLAPGVNALVEPHRESWGIPDFCVKRKDLRLGYIEAKDVGANLDDVAASEQLKDRYLPASPNLVLTNYLEFRWYVEGKERKTARLGRLSGRHVIASREGVQEVTELLEGFLAHTPQGAASAKDLALRLARLTHEIHNVIAEAFRAEVASQDLCDLLEVMRASLLPDLSPEQFADMFAQTLTYGFFAARCNHRGSRQFRRLGAAAEIPKTNPLLRRLFESITGESLEEEPFAGYVDDVIQLLDRTDLPGILEDFGRRDGRTDPIIHFYQTFLAAYDPKLRELRGVYYTPDEVVSYMVHSVDHLLRTRFGCGDGLAERGSPTGGSTHSSVARVRPEVGPTGTRRVLILDPACGTGTFLYAIISHIREEFMRQRNAGAWSSYVREHLLPRLFGFELLMAPYAVAHLKLGMQLAGQDLDEPARSTWKYDFVGDERLGVYLTNSLEKAVFLDQPGLGPYRSITDEANAAVAIKRDKPIMVVIGNPPYSGHSANLSRRPHLIQTSDGGTRWAEEITFVGKLLQDYYQVDGKPLGEKNPKWLQNDYVKFIRFGQWRIAETEEGILALITDHSYLDNPTFRGMREQLMHAFTDIYLLDLHGNSRKKERTPEGGKDENVFDIQQGVAIALFVKERNAPGPARIWHADLWGSREAKHAALLSNDVNSIVWRELHPTSPAYLFVPQDTALLPEYEQGWPIYEAFEIGSMGMNTHRDGLVIDFGLQPLIRRIADILDQGIPEAEIAARYSLSEAKVRAARATLAGDTEWASRIIPCLYRPFDPRFLFYDPALVDRPRASVNAHVLKGNLSLITTRQTRDPFGAMVTDLVCGQHKITAVYDGSSFFPLYLYPSEGGLFEYRAAGFQPADPSGSADGVGSQPAGQQGSATGGLETRRTGPQPADLGGSAASEPDTRPTETERPLFAPVTADLRITRRNLPHWEAGGSSYSIRFSLHPSGSLNRAAGFQPAGRKNADLSTAERAIVKQAILFWHGRKWTVHILTVMPDHVHIIATPLQNGPDAWYPLSEILHSVKRHSSLEINRLRGTRGSLWLGESYDRLIRNQKEFDEWFTYLLGNAVNRGLVKDGWKWDGLWLECDGPVSDDRPAGLKTRAAGFQPAVPTGSTDGGLETRRTEFQPAGPENDPLGGLETRRTESARRPNLHPDFIKECAQRLSLRFLPDGAGDLSTALKAGLAEDPCAPLASFGPEEVFNYIYAILHCPTYRTRYADFLKRDFPRIPLTSDRELFAALVAKGRDLVALHLLESPRLNDLITSFPVAGSGKVERVQYNENEQRVYINKTQYFDGVPREVWRFHVGGYQVCDKWLKDRKGRELSYEDIEHYQRTVVALRETIRLMSEIDGLIPAWPVT